MPGDIIILHLCTTSDDHVMYGSWDMERADRIFCHFEPLFALSPCSKPKKSKFEKIKKKTLEISIILHKCTKYDDDMLYCS